MKNTINAFLIAVGILSFVPKSFADFGVVEATAAINNGTGTLFISTIGGGTNPRWNAYDLGTYNFDLSPAPTLSLSNFYFENYAYNAAPSGTDNWLDANSTATFRLFRDGTLLNTTQMRQSNVAGNNRNWDLNASGVSINILDGLTGRGTYTLSWTVDWTYNQFGGGVTGGSVTTTSGGNATFSTVPEPSSSLLMGLGLAGLAVLRRTRKNA